MGMLDRYKKGGILELVKLIESSPEVKKNQLLQMVKAEDPDFYNEIESRLFSYEKLKTLPEGIVAEVVASSPPKFVAVALVDEDPEFVKLCERCLGKNFNEYKAEKETLEASKPAPANIEAARRKLVAEARKLEAEGRFKITGGGSVGGAPAVSSSTGAALEQAGGSGGATGTATADGGCPALASFQLEPPPPGLLGERFDNFIKSNLGIK